MTNKIKMIKDPGLIFLPEGIKYPFRQINALDPGQLTEMKNATEISEKRFSALNFCRRWLSGQQQFETPTSGSTSIAKKFTLHRSYLQASAKRTLDFFDLKPGMSAFLPLSIDHIAGKMMLVRAMTGKLQLSLMDATAHIPMPPADQIYDFSVMVPMQISNLLKYHSPQMISRHFPLILLGGSRPDPQLIRSLQQLDSPVYIGYGMTETCSHVALRRLNGHNPDNFYIPMPNVEFSLSDDQRLIINDNASSAPPLLTNDLAEINDTGCLNILGRSDNVINSGGIKIHPEYVEQIISDILTDLQPIDSPDNSTKHYLIGSEKDPALGQKCILITDDPAFDDKNWEQLLHKMHQSPQLHKYEIPKSWHYLKDVPRTPNGKIRRNQLIACT